MTSGGAAAFDQAWRKLHPAARRSLELAYESLASGGLAVGSVLTDNRDAVIAEGRNRAYDPPGGGDALQGTPLAHAEMNALAAVRIDQELDRCTLWSTQEPCSMCSSAASFVGVGSVRYLAPDPWAVAARPAAPSAVQGELTGRRIGPAEDFWVVSANLLFLHAIASRAGAKHVTVVGNRELEPETAALALELISEGRNGSALTDGRSLTSLFSSLWDRIAAAALARSERMRA